MNKVVTIAILACCGVLLLPVTTNAYVGPGAGLSLLGALWALLVAVAAAVVFLFAWPIRRMRRRKREAKELEERERAQRSAHSVPDPEKPQSAAVYAQETSDPRAP